MKKGGWSGKKKRNIFHFFFGSAEYRGVQRGGTQAPQGILPLISRYFT
jgi:hypothetical protein